MKRAACFLAILMLFFPGASALESRDELRSLYNEIAPFQGSSPYEEVPSLERPYTMGRISADAQREALASLNFLRRLADLEPVETNEVYTFECQHGAMLMAIEDDVEHMLPQPRGMDDAFYAEASAALASSNVARFNWMRPNILREAVAYFIRDDGEANLPVLGHRRWLLNPNMGQTGFGLANSSSGMTYVALYAHDMIDAPVSWSEVCWPSEGVFPCELMHGHLAWSIMLDPDEYDVPGSDIAVVLRETVSGAEFVFYCSSGMGNGFCAVNQQAYARSACVIFRPDLETAGITDYLQNQIWEVDVTGLKGADGRERELNYTVQMVSLYVQEVFAVELSCPSATLRRGDSMRLSAEVVPSYADDLSIIWTSSDETAATVGDDGTVRAVSPGMCVITAASANGCLDSCAITVEEGAGG